MHLSPALRLCQVFPDLIRASVPQEKSQLSVKRTRAPPPRAQAAKDPQSKWDSLVLRAAGQPEGPWYPQKEARQASHWVGQWQASLSYLHPPTQGFSDSCLPLSQPAGQGVPGQESVGGGVQTRPSQAKFLGQVLPAPTSWTPDHCEGLMDVECPHLDGLPGKAQSVSKEAVQTSHHSPRRPSGSCTPWPPSLRNTLDQTVLLGCFRLRKVLGLQQESPG